MQKRHSNPEQYFNEQIISTQKYVLPFIGSIKPLIEKMQVLEIGCGEAGNLKPFLDLGCNCTGVDYSLTKIERGEMFFALHPNVHLLKLINEDIYKITEFESKFDLIILRDVIEHIHDQNKFLGMMKNLLSKGGVVFLAFPPWQNPFGGHQQLCKSIVLSHAPYIHLLPKLIYKLILKAFGENNSKIQSLLDIKKTGISLERFEILYRKNGYKLLMKRLYFINPAYEVKFGLKPRKLSFWFNILLLRNFYTSSGYYLLGLK